MRPKRPAPARFGALCALIVFAAPAGAQPAPPGPAPVPSPSPAPAPAPAPAASCLDRLTAAGVRAERAVVEPSATCTVEDPVRLVSVAAGNRQITFPDRPILACGFAATVAAFARDLVAPLAAGRLGQPLTAIPTGSGFECRTRNRVPGARLSAHATGIAVDVAGFVLADGRRLPVATPRDDADRAFLGAVRMAACGWFTTVLGPGSDASHTAHMHFDALVRGQGRVVRLCE